LGFNQLLTNAITSSENSKISVKREKHIIFEVTDKGKGIDNHYKNKVLSNIFKFLAAIN
jgi:signal transduction histidine kinase